MWQSIWVSRSENVPVRRAAVIKPRRQGYFTPKTDQSILQDVPIYRTFSYSRVHGSIFCHSQLVSVCYPLQLHHWSLYMLHPWIRFLHTYPQSLTNTVHIGRHVIVSCWMVLPALKCSKMVNPWFHCGIIQPLEKKQSQVGADCCVFTEPSWKRSSKYQYWRLNLALPSMAI